MWFSFSKFIVRSKLKAVWLPGELLVIVEYCRYGNIQNYLIRNRASFINQVDSRGYINPSIGEDQLAEADAQFVQSTFVYFPLVKEKKRIAF